MASRSDTSPVAEYFASIVDAIKTTLIGLGVTGKYLLKKPVTMHYPDEKPVIPVGYRGFHVYDIATCTACGLCRNACPVSCIDVESLGKGKNAQILRYEVDYNRCLFCGFCVEACPTNCLRMGSSYDYAQYRPEDCLVNFVRLATEQNLQSPTGETIKRSEAPPKAPAAS